MPDPVSKIEIEDVLSSIRRLVSEEPDGLRRRKVVAEAQDRLVLTPAQRIQEGPDEPGNDAETAWEPDGQDEPDLSEIARLGQSGDREDDQGVVREATRDDVETEACGAAAIPPLTLVDRVAGLETALGEAGGEWEPDGSEDGTSDETRPLSADTEVSFEEAWERDTAEFEARERAETDGPSVDPGLVDSLILQASKAIPVTYAGTGGEAREVHAETPPEPKEADKAVDTVEADAPAPGPDHAKPAEPEQEAPEIDDNADLDPEESVERWLEEVAAQEAEAEDDRKESKGDESEDVESGVAEALGEADEPKSDEMPQVAEELAEDVVASAEADQVHEAIDHGQESHEEEVAFAASTDAPANVSKAPAAMEKDEDTVVDWEDLPRPNAFVLPSQGTEDDVAEAELAEQEDPLDPKPTLRFFRSGGDASPRTESGQEDADKDSDADTGFGDLGEETGTEADGNDADDRDGFNLYSEETTIDEEALRELVSELVRQELQGVLGERITRNVRRLVRREIERALALRELS